jgi:hypothetical protein
MVFQRLLRKLQMEHSKENKILRIFYFLLIFYTGCTTPERARGLEAHRQLAAAIKWELNEKNDQAQEDKVLVALYLDTEDGSDSMTKAEYRCYSVGRGGYSGIKSVPYKTPWLTWERVRTNDFKKEIVIDPGPPYRNATIIVNLIPGEVTNLGRIVLEKVKAEGTASISGIIKDERGRLLEGVTVSSEKGDTTTDSEGYYRIEGLSLEVCNMEVTKKGYIPNSSKVSIRDMDKRIIQQDFVLSFPRRVKFRYVISPEGKDDFNAIDATGGTAEFYVNKKYFPIVVDHSQSDDFRRFVDKTRLNFRVNGNKLTLNNSYAPIFYESVNSSRTEFESVKSVGPLQYNSQHCPEIHESDIILINGGRVSDYTIKILFEEIEPVVP